jgi:nucleoside-diphosphate-sugar epimerase
MNVVLLGFNGQIGNAILYKLKKLKKIKIICVGRNNVPKFSDTNIKYIKWDFVSFKTGKLKFLNNANIIINCVGKNYNTSNKLQYINVLFVESLLKYISIKKLNLRLIHLSSVSVYGVNYKYLFKNIYINESFLEAPNDLYSTTKLKADNLIKKTNLYNQNNFSYTILRVSNVIGLDKDSNLFRLVFFLLKRGIWIKCTNKTLYNFIHVDDVARAVILVINNLKVSRNKIYITSNDENQKKVYEIFAYNNKIKLITIPISLQLIKFICNYFIMPKKIVNFFLTVSSQISYSNSKLKKELYFKPKYYLKNKIL